MYTQVGAKSSEVGAKWRQSQTKMDKMVELNGQDDQDRPQTGGRWKIITLVVDAESAHGAEGKVG